MPRIVVCAGSIRDAGPRCLSARHGVLGLVGGWIAFYCVYKDKDQYIHDEILKVRLDCEVTLDRVLELPSFLVDTMHLKLSVLASTFACAASLAAAVDISVKSTGGNATNGHQYGFLHEVSHIHTH